MPFPVFYGIISPTLYFPDTPELRNKVTALKDNSMALNALATDFQDSFSLTQIVNATSRSARELGANGTECMEIHRSVVDGTVTEYTEAHLTPEFVSQDLAHHVIVWDGPDDTDATTLKQSMRNSNKTTGILNLIHSFCTQKGVDTTKPFPVFVQESDKGITAFTPLSLHYAVEKHPGLLTAPRFPKSENIH